MIKEIGFAVLAAAFAGSVFAAGHVKFGDIDTDQDGMISAAEAEAAGMDLSEADANQDGSVDEAEFAKFAEEKPAE